MKKLGVLLITLLTASSTMPQTTQPCSSCLPEGITFSTQEEIDNFQTNYPGCTEIEGYVTISGSDITNLNGLSVVTFIGLWLSIIYNDSLTSLTGLDNVTSIGGRLDIYYNDALTSLTGLDNVTSIGGELYITHNNSLSICDAEWLCNYIFNPSGSIWIQGNANGCNSVIELANACGGSVPCLPYGDYHFVSQADIDYFQTAFSNCTALQGHVKISESDITNLSGLNNLTSIGGDLWIYFNDALTSLSGLDNVTSIGDDLYIFYNDALTSLTGLDNVTSIGGELDIFYNDALSSCAVQSICDYLAAPNGTIEIYGNAVGCNSQVEVEAACWEEMEESSTAENHINMYPNPTSITIIIEILAKPPKNTNLTIYNINGQQLIERHITEPTTMIDVDALPSGIYVVRLMWENGLQVRKFVRK